MDARAELEELRRLDELERKASGSAPVPAPAPVPTPVPENTLGQEAKRQVGLFLRHAVNAAASPAVLFDRIQAKAADAVAGKHIGGSLGEDLNARLTGLGLPESERPIEKFTQGVAEAAPATAVPAAFVPQVLSNAAIAAAQAPAGQEGTQAAIGGILGGFLPAAASAVKGAKNMVADAVGPLRETWRTSKAREMFKDVLGGSTDDIARYIQENARPGVSAADLIAEMNMGSATKRGSPLVAFEDISARTPVLSDTAKSLKAAQEQGRIEAIGSFAKTPEAIAAAKVRRDAVTAPMRETAISNANIAGNAPKYLRPGLEAGAGFVPLKPDDVLKHISRITRAKENLTNPTVQSAMGEVEDLIQNAVNKEGVIPAEALYTLRKEAGNVIEKFSNENKSWDKRFTSKLLMGVQNSIDDAIEKAGGNTGDWKRYLDTYKARSTGISQMETGQELINALRSGVGTERPGMFASKARQLEQDADVLLSPAQRQKVDTVGAELARDQERKLLSSKISPSELSSPSSNSQFKLPHVLSRTATIANAVLDKIGHGADEKIMADAGKLMLTDPAAFASKYLTGVPEKEKGAVIKYLMDSGKFAESAYSTALISSLRKDQ